MKFKNKYFFSALVAACCFLATVIVQASSLTVFAAASLTDSLKEIGANYEKQTGQKVDFNFEASSTLARQIQEGAPADIFFSADETQMDRLAKQDLIDPSTRQDRLGNTLVVIVPVDSTLQIHSPGDLAQADVKQIALADPKSVPAGVYAKTWLEKLQLWEAVKSKVIPTENVRGALAAVVSGNVEAGIVYKTDATISKKVKIAYEVSGADSPHIRYPMAMVKASSQPDAAKKFLAYLDSEDASKAFSKFGFAIRGQ
jgi:molybdate transport system substrate-binding protein